MTFENKNIFTLLHESLFERFRKERWVMFPMGQGSLAVSALLDESRVATDEYESHCGSWPLIPVLANFNWKTLNLENHLGTLASPSGLNDKSKVCKLCSLASWEGSLPEIQFLDKSSVWRLIKLSKDGGILPLNSLFAKNKSVKLVRWPMVAGNIPVCLLFSRIN